MTKKVIGAVIGTVLTSDMSRKAIVDTLSKTFALLQMVFAQTEQVDVQQKLKHLNIQFNLELIEAVMNDIEKMEQLTDKASVAIALKHLHDIVSTIHKEIDGLNKKLQYHATKWFSSYRPHNCRSSLKRLAEYKVTLLESYHALTTILQILQIYR
ncbi:MAG: hypothetical protein Faunusvirus7_30 [Faunusvirus sp.]|uniref:Uncharacterized protein n=1 Tax=Faunusvirus sp. TaxID=2487766 RepID=A0A3G4ZWJ0_9VIRU|nr:MAG: hypothetical protein Faunusvirus7_30 [Faunusvirus sp.]